MNKLSFHAWAVVAMLLAGPALANHCDTNFDEAQAAIDNAYSLEPNVEDAVAALLPAAIEACQLEEAQLASAEPGSIMLEPDYVSVGQSMLINVTALVTAP
ncbi:hypothetical protein PH586_01325 [Pseudomonas sp. SA3-5]|uniref:Uncharacterized protein n=1 Tax=Pseudomonas aestuarii TaxID=3018340 RepID=A0ABT4XAW7_9PSED|nr:hypothetical protein [Pseudomonas aestuarii]MDA7085030.1 hypothetical protein [Pseudomonas aestuarii]